MSHEDSGPRLAVEADVPRLSEIVDMAYGIYLPRMDRPPAPMSRDLRPAIRAGQCWVVGHPVMGLICLTRTGDALLVENVAVHPDAQGRGLGRQLMGLAEDQAGRLGVARLWLYTNEVMTENLALYAHLGFHELDRRIEDGYRRVFLQKILSPGRHEPEPPG